MIVSGPVSKMDQPILASRQLEPQSFEFGKRDRAEGATQGSWPMARNPTLRHRCLRPVVPSPKLSSPLADLAPRPSGVQDTTT